MAALTEQAERLLYQHNAPPCANPLEALQRLAGRALALEETIGRLVNGLAEIRYEDAKGAEQLRSEVAVLERAMDRAGRLLFDIAKLNIDERLTRIEQDKVELIAKAVGAAVREVGLDGEQAAAAKRAVGRHLRSVG